MSTSTNVKNTKPTSGELDALIVGGGFSGIYTLYRLRKLGISVKLFEGGSGLGGTWYWNCYPGARVDSDFCVYQFSIEEVWKDWNYTERFPGWKEIRGYFNHLDKKLDLSRDISYDTWVVSAKFNPSTNRWAVTTHDGTTVHPRYFVLCTGFAAKPYTPEFKGIENFKGIWTHSARWPQGGIDLKNKRVGVVGTGASGVQVTQESARVGTHVTVFQRTPCIAFPLGQYKVDEKTQANMKEELLPHILRRRFQTFNGFHYTLNHQNVADLSPEEIMIFFEELWDKGGFRFWLSGYSETLRNEEFNRRVYAFWRRKVLEKIHDPEMQRKLAPIEPPYPIGTKRPCLEDDYYEIFNQSNVDLIDVNENPIAEITSKGIKTEDGVEHELDILVFATGFDAISGSLTQIDIRGLDGVSLGDKWKDGTTTCLGLMTTGFPNMFFPFGPHGPTALCNGPTCAEIQGGWVADCLDHLRKNHITRIVPSKEAEDEWVKLVWGFHNAGLWGKGKTSWFIGGNIPGRKVEPMNFTGGVNLYGRKCRESIENELQGFIMTGSDADVEAEGERAML